MNKRIYFRYFQILLIFFMAFGVFLGITQWVGGVRPAHALPEYTNRTGESCGTCHISAGGGGPRTLRGLLWAAQGRPDQLPVLSGNFIPPEITDGLELYDIACAGCHGYQGEGLFAMHLVETGISRTAVRSFILRGIPASGMPAFEGQFTTEQLNSLVDFVAGLTSGEVELLNDYPLSPATLGCDPINTETICGGN